MTTFDKSSIRAFRFVRCSFDAETGVARLVYAFDEGPELTETVTIPGAPFALSGILVGQADELLARYAEWFDDLAVATREDWVRIAGRRRGG